jgi:aspartate-semialdehyde dehydrogenase
MIRAKQSYRIAIVNPLTLVGAELKSILHDRGFHYAEIELIDTTGSDEGVLTVVDESAAFVREASEEAFAGVDIVFFCGPREKNERWIARYDEDGFTAIDLSQPAALEAEGVAVVAGVNEAALAAAPALIVSPHPVATTLIVLLDALRKRFEVRLCAASVIQPASEFDKRGVDELYAQTVNALNLHAVPKDVFGRQLAFNMYPAADSQVVEHYIATQIRGILGPAFPVTVSLMQGTVFHGHTFSLFVQLPEETPREALIAALEASRAIAVVDEESFSTIDAAGKDQLLVGRVSADPNIDGGYWISAVADNLRRGSALNAALVVEALVARVGPPVS